jgi:peptide/nickel transport system permease protein
VLLRVVGRWLATVIGVAALLLALVDAAPGDAIDLLPDGESLRAELETRWSLGRPLPERLAVWLAAVARGDLGTSWVVRPGEPVSQLFAGPALDSLVRLLAASVLSMLVSLAVAWRAAGRTSWLRGSISAVSLTPVFLLAHLAIMTLNATAWRAIEAGWIDRPEWFALPTEASALRALLAVALLAVGSAALSGLIADLEEALVRLRKAPFVLAARARGEDARLMIARNLLPTAVALLADRLAFFVGGLVILEKVFLLGGAGSLLWRASLERDVEVVLAIGLGTAVVVATGRLAGDVSRAWLDPRLALTPSR